MIITTNGGNSFKVQAGDVVILIDPENQRSFKGASLVLNTIRPTLTDAPDAPPGDGTPFWIDHQGEYEVSGIMVRGYTTGWSRDEEHTAYRFALDGIELAVLGHLTSEPTPMLESALAGADIAIVPAGGKPFLPVPSVAKFVRQMEPSIVIPALATDLKPFFKEMGGEKSAAQEKLTIKKKDLAPKAMTVVWLTS
jgi:hypothetical protein